MSVPVRDIYIAVIGAIGVGKSTFIQRAFDLKAPPATDEIPSISMMVERSRCNVKLIEIDWSKIDFEKQPPQWPAVCYHFDSVDFGANTIDRWN